MKKLVLPHLLSLLLLGVFFLTSGFRFTSDEDAVVKLDGQVIIPEGTITLDRDDTVYLEVEGVKPNSTVDVEVKKLGIKWMEDSYEVDESGGVKTIVFVPEKKITVNCKVTYYTPGNDLKTVEFKFKVV